MRGGWKIALVLFGLAVVSALLLSVAPTRALRDLEATRRQLRREGFKIDLKEFDLSLTPELNARAALIGTTTRAALTNRSRLRLMPLPAIPFMVPVETNAALLRWKSELAQFRNEYEPPIDLWAQLRGARETNHPPATTLAAAISGPIRFEPIGFPAPNPCCRTLPISKT